MKNRRHIWLLVILAWGCRQDFNPTIHYPDTGYLVVEGFINSGQGLTQIRLSRTIPLNDSADIKTESRAALTVEGDDNSSYPLIEQASGSYENPQLTLSSASKYRLHIKTSNGHEYYSDFASAARTPPIDSVSWTRDADGLQFSVNSHDPANNTHYYNWTYEETWELDATYVPFVQFTRDHSNYVTGLEYIHADESPDTTGRRCWKFGQSTVILTASSAKLAQDVVQSPLFRIPKASEKLAYLYSVRVLQHALSPNGYEFLQRLKKNTEETGSIFDSQPSELITNIHNTADQSEVVYGYVDVSELQESRIFISPAQVPGWEYSQGCEYLVVYPRDNLDTLNKYSYYAPLNYTYYGFAPALAIATPVCADCRLTGGINQKPPYWPR